MKNIKKTYMKEKKFSGAVLIDDPLNSDSETLDLEIGELLTKRLGEIASEIQTIEKKHPLILVVKIPFFNHKKGDLITGYDEVEEILNSSNLNLVNKINTFI